MRPPLHVWAELQSGTDSPIIELGVDWRDDIKLTYDRGDRRAHERFQLMDYALVYAEGDSDPQRAVVCDLSLGGLQLRSKSCLEPGRRFRLVIGQGEERPLTVHAESRYCTPVNETLFATGFRFRPQTVSERADLVTYVHEVFKDQGESLLS